MRRRDVVILSFSGRLAGFLAVTLALFFCHHLLGIGNSILKGGKEGMLSKELIGV